MCISIYVCRKKPSRRKIYIWWFVYLPTHFDFKVLSEYKNILSKLFLYVKNYNRYFGGFSGKSSSGFVDVAMKTTLSTSPDEDF